MVGEITALDRIVEVVECGARKANEYMAHGYTLLAINGASSWKNLENSKVNGWVLKVIVYTVGRTADVERFVPEPRQ